MSALRNFACGALLIGSVACASRDRMALPEPVEDFDQQQWANTSPYGEGAPSSVGYYGVGSESGEPAPTRAAARPEPRSNGREPATPKSTRARLNR